MSWKGGKVDKGWTNEKPFTNCVWCIWWQVKCNLRSGVIQMQRLLLAEPQFKFQFCWWVVLFASLPVTCSFHFLPRAAVYYWLSLSLSLSFAVQLLSYHSHTVTLSSRVQLQVTLLELWKRIPHKYQRSNSLLRYASNSESCFNGYGNCRVRVHSWRVIKVIFSLLPFAISHL